MDGHTGESPSVFSKQHCFELLCSDPSFLFNFNFFTMHNNQDESTISANGAGVFLPLIKNSHKEDRPSLFKRLNRRKHSQLVHDFMVEMDAKNTAYHFILQNGYFDEFVDYCDESRKEANHANDN